MSIKGTIGQNISSTNDSAANYTWIDKRNPATAKGVLKTIVVTATCDATQSAKLKIFRIVGSNYEIVSDQVISGLTTGENTVNIIPVNIEIGDLIGWWNGTGTTRALLKFVAGTGTGNHYKVNTDVTTTTTVASWTVDTSTLDIFGNILSIPSGSFSIGNPMIFY